MLLRIGLMLLATSLMVACGGGGGSVADPPAENSPSGPPIIVGTELPPDVHWSPPAGATPASGNYVYLQSDVGDAMGRGTTSLYTQAESSIVYEFAAARHLFHIANPQHQWLGEFVSDDVLRVGFYGNALPPDTRSHAHPGLLWQTRWRGCKAMDGWFVVDAMTRDAGGVIDGLELRFVQRCEGTSAALRGKLRWQRDAQRSGPINPAPAALWQPPAGAVPSAGSYLYLESDAADYVGEGRKRLFTRDNATLDVARYDFFYSVAAVTGQETWTGNLFAISERELRRGYYPGVQRYPYAISAIGAMEWRRERRGCGAVNGWYAVDDVVYEGDFIVYLELRFEQRCDESQAVLRGKLRWSIDDFLLSPGPVNPPPAALWQPPAGAVPASGDYVYLESEPGDSVGQGRARLFTAGPSMLAGVPYTDSFHIRTDDGATSAGGFQAMDSVKTLQTGLYGDLPHLSQHDRRKGGLAWSVDGRRCSESRAWVSIDRIDYAASGSIAALELRFEQRCAGDSGALRGKLRWSAAASSPHALHPPPAHLWQPAPDKFPTSGNYVYVESDFWDPLAGGESTLETSLDSIVLARGEASPLPGNSSFGVSLQEPSRWEGSFHLPHNAGRLVPGLHGNLRGRGNAGAAGLTWTGRGTTCGEATAGWYAVDRVAYEGELLTDIELRFEQHCDGFPGALRGKIRWSAADPQRPPGPMQPPPAGLWEPPAAAVPASGDYVYLESEYGDFVGVGRTTLLTPSSATIDGHGFSNDARVFSVTARELREGSLPWFGSFRTMDSVDRLEPGFYDGLRREGYHNKAKGGLDWNGEGRGCNTVSGWFVVDAVGYSNGVLSAIELRFEQHCEARSAPLRGKIRWTKS